MKHISIIFTLFLLIVFTSTSTAQIDWTKYSGNPVLAPGPAGAWDGGFVSIPSVLFDGSTYHMWYNNVDKVNETLKRVGYATSPDGITWTKYDDPNTTGTSFVESDPVLNPGQPGEWDDESVGTPSVLLSDSIYHMWYYGSNLPSTSAPAGFGHASSTDGINWVKDTLNNPILIPGNMGDWDDEWISAPSVLFDGSNYHMWYDAWNGLANQIRIGHATSPDGISWIKDPNNPVLSYGTAGSWDYPRVDAPNVVFDGAIFHMWYSGGEWYEWRIGYAWSQDGSNWTKYDNNPVLDRGAAGAWDDYGVAHCAVILDTLSNTFKMWYSGADALWSNSIGYATAPAILNVPGKFESIQAAIDAASDGNTVLVDEGTYYENINFKGKAITVASHYFMDGDTSHISNTIIDGSQPSDADSGSVVFFVSGEDTTSVLYGFTISGGSGTITEYTWRNVVYSARAGGGIFCYKSGASILENKIMNNHIPNYAESGGGGISGFPNGSAAYVIIDGNKIVNNTATGNNAWSAGVDLTCNGTLKNNDISFNTANATNNGFGAVGCWSEVPRTVEIINNQIRHNIATGGTWARSGGISIEEKMNVSVIDNEISYNEVNGSGGNGELTRGGGIHVVSNTGTTVIDKNTISNNMVNGSSGASGGGIALRSNINNPLITNNIISGNSAGTGGGINSLDSKAKIINNTIANNSARSGGGLRTDNSQLVVINTILWGNQAEIIGPQITQIGGLNVAFSDIEGEVWEGEGNISSDPLFADSLFNLSESSPCVGNGIDSHPIGDNTYFAPEFDIYGNERPNEVDEYVDMGAVESPYERVIIYDISDSDLKIPYKFELAQNYPNPFNPTTAIGYQLSAISDVELSVYNLLGQKVATLVKERQRAGHHQVEWDASRFSSGVYFYRIQAGEFQDVKKMVLIK